MEFLDKLVLPHSGPNLELLKYLLILAQMIFLIFSGTLLGSSILSFATGLIANRKNQTDYIRLSVDYIDLILSNKMMGIGLGIIPLFSILMIYIQLYHKSGSEITSMLVLASALYLFGYILLLVYRSLLHKKNITQFLSSDVANSDSKPHLNSAMSLPGIVVVFLSLWMYNSIISVTIDASRWVSGSDLLSVILSFHGLIEFLNFLTISLALTGAAYLVKTFYWDRPENLSNSYFELARKLNTSIALIFSLILPALLVLNTILTPDSTISNLPFALILAAIILTFLLVHLLYSNLKTKTTNYATLSFYLIISVFALIVIKGQMSFSVASREQILSLAHDFEIKEAALLEKMGKSVSSVNGEEIYQAKCVACHKYDEKLVGPPHKLVMAKYQGKQDEMVKFILNPVKVDPAYPPMPAQGLTPKEAKAVVEYLYKHYGQSK